MSQTHSSDTHWTFSSFGQFRCLCIDLDVIYDLASHLEFDEEAISDGLMAHYCVLGRF